MEFLQVLITSTVILAFLNQVELRPTRAAHEILI